MWTASKHGLKNAEMTGCFNSHTKFISYGNTLEQGAHLKQKEDRPKAQILRSKQ